MRSYLISGLVLAVDGIVAGADEVPPGTPADLVVTRRGERPVPPTIAPGRRLQAVTWGEQMQYSTVESVDGSVLLRLHGTVDFVVGADRRTVEAWTDPSCEPEMLGILVAGNLLATVLALRGETVLHASAVEVAGRAVAFVAHSGMGKSTLAALACARGARFVTDDLLRLRHVDGEPVRCWPGLGENRLRRPLGDIVDAAAAGGEPTRTSIDGRTVWRPPPAAAPPELASVVLPVLDDDRREVEVCELTAGAALLELTRRPRILGWEDAAVRARAFTELARLVRSVPVYLARLPWGPPFDPGAVDVLLAAAGVPVSGRGTPTPAA